MVEDEQESEGEAEVEDEQELESETEFENDAISIDTVVIEANLMPLPEPIVEDEQFHSEP